MEYKPSSTIFLGDIILLEDSKREPLSSMQRASRKGQYPYYGAQGIVDYLSDYTFEGKRLLVAEDGENLRSRKLPIANSVDGRFRVNNHAHVLCETSKCNIDYLRFYLNSTDISAYITGSTQPKLSQASLLGMRLDLPPKEKQDAIVSFLAAIERKINLNTRLNGYLEELASALYKKFVASADGRMGTLADLVGLQKDSTRVGKHPELPYMPIDVMPMKHIGVTEFKANEEAKSSLQLFRRDDIVIGAMRVYFHRVVLAPCEGITRNTCFVLRPRSSSLREYALLTCFQPEAIEYANVRSKGSTMPYAVWENSFETYPVLIPEERQLDRFSKQLAPLIDWIRDSYRENNKLASLRDVLLPKLMSGEIDVSRVDLTQLNSHLA